MQKFQKSYNHRINSKVEKQLGGGEIQYSLNLTYQGDGGYWLHSLTGVGEVVNVSGDFFRSVEVGDYLTFSVAMQDGKK